MEMLSWRVHLMRQIRIICQGCLISFLSYQKNSFKRRTSLFLLQVHTTDPIINHHHHKTSENASHRLGITTWNPSAPPQCSPSRPRQNLKPLKPIYTGYVKAKQQEGKVKEVRETPIEGRNYNGAQLDIYWYIKWIFCRHFNS